MFPSFLRSPFELASSSGFFFVPFFFFAFSVPFFFCSSTQSRTKAPSSLLPTQSPNFFSFAKTLPTRSFTTNRDGQDRGSASLDKHNNNNKKKMKSNDLFLFFCSLSFSSFRLFGNGNQKEDENLHHFSFGSSFWKEKSLRANQETMSRVCRDPSIANRK